MGSFSFRRGNGSKPSTFRSFSFQKPSGVNSASPASSAKLQSPPKFMKAVKPIAISASFSSKIKPKFQFLPQKKQISMLTSIKRENDEFEKEFRAMDAKCVSRQTEEIPKQTVKTEPNRFTVSPGPVQDSSLLESTLVGKNAHEHVAEQRGRIEIVTKHFEVYSVLSSEEEKSVQGQEETEQTFEDRSTAATAIEEQSEAVLSKDPEGERVFPVQNLLEQKTTAVKKDNAAISIPKGLSFSNTENPSDEARSLVLAKPNDMAIPPSGSRSLPPVAPPPPPPPPPPHATMLSSQIAHNAMDFIAEVDQLRDEIETLVSDLSDLNNECDRLEKDCLLPLLIQTMQGNPFLLELEL